MLSVNDIPPVSLRSSIVGPCGVLVIGHGQVLGGGSVVGPPSSDGPPPAPGKKPTTIVIRDAWVISDLTQPWVQLVAGEQAVVIQVPIEVEEAVRDSLSRFHAFGHQAITAEKHRREGTLEAIQSLAITLATMQPGKPGGQ